MKGAGIEIAPATAKAAPKIFFEVGWGPSRAKVAEILAVGMSVFWMEDGFQYFGQVAGVPKTEGVVTDSEGKSLEASREKPLLTVKRAVLRGNDLVVTDSTQTIEAAAVTVIDKKFTIVTEKVRGFDSQIASTVKSSTPVEDSNGRVIDYINVEVDGYLSTFQGTTPRDREGDYVLPGAFKDTIPQFMTNPVMLRNHRNTTEDVVGQYVEMREDQKGLKVRAKVSNAPGLTDLRFKLVERSIRCMSMGGLWVYLEDGYGIARAYLHEGSIVAVPMNPDAIFQTRSLTNADTKRYQDAVVISGKTASRE